MTSREPSGRRSEQKAVVAAVDGSRSRSTTAIMHAAALARSFGAPLRLLHAVAVPFAGAELTPYEIGLDREQGEATLARCAEEAHRLAPDLTVTTRLVVEDATAALVAASHDAEAIVLARRDTGIAERLLTGSTSSQVATRAECPVLVAPAGSRPQLHGPVVVAIDGDSPSHAALTYAFEVARRTGADLTVLHATPRGGLHPGLRGLGEVLAGWRQEYPDVEVTTRAVEASTVDACAAATRDARLLVLGRHRTTGARLPWIRSIARAVLSRASCPVVTVPHDAVDAGYDPYPAVSPELAAFQGPII